MGVPGLTDLLSPLGVAEWRVACGLRKPVAMSGTLERFGELGDIDPRGLIDSASPAQLDAIRGGLGQPLAAPDDSDASIRIKRTQLIDARIRAFMLALHQDLGEELNVNAYLSPSADTQGLAPHRDGYDVLVLQLRGSKRWWIEGLAEPQIDLGAGDVLSLPAGLLHRAQNLHAEPSFHLTVGILSKTEHSVIEWLMSELAAGAGDYDDRDDGVFERLAVRAERCLADPHCRERFVAHRRAVEYERMLASCEEHLRLDARRYR